LGESTGDCGREFCRPAGAVADIREDAVSLRGNKLIADGPPPLDMPSPRRLLKKPSSVEEELACAKRLLDPSLLDREGLPAVSGRN
jgi:hypothetical protein